MEVKTVPIQEVKPDLGQPRKIFSDKYIAGLAESLKVEGIINPVEVDSTLTIITGEQRYRAAKLAGWTELPVNINKTVMSPYERFRRQMAENLHQSSAGGGSQMNPLDVAKGYKKLIEMSTGKDYQAGLLSRTEVYGLIKDISKDLGVTTETIYEYLSLLNEPANVMEDIAKGRPRTYYQNVRHSPEEYKGRLRKAIIGGKIDKRDDIIRFNQVAKMFPEKAEIEFAKITRKLSEGANQILNRALSLQVILKKTELKSFSEMDKKMITEELKTVKEAIERYLN